jgi:hypothetical protein
MGRKTRNFIKRRPPDSSSLLSSRGVTQEPEPLSFEERLRRRHAGRQQTNTSFNIPSHVLSHEQYLASVSSSASSSTHAGPNPPATWTSTSYRLRHVQTQPVASEHISLQYLCLRTICLKYCSIYSINCLAIERLPTHLKQSFLHVRSSLVSCGKLQRTSNSILRGLVDVDIWDLDLSHSNVSKDVLKLFLGDKILTPLLSNFNIHDSWEDIYQACLDEDVELMGLLSLNLSYSSLTLTPQLASMLSLHASNLRTLLLSGTNITQPRQFMRAIGVGLRSLQLLDLERCMWARDVVELFFQQIKGSDDDDEFFEDEGLFPSLDVIVLRGTGIGENISEKMRPGIIAEFL